MAEFTQQQINKIMEFASNIVTRQKFGIEREETKETGLKSLTEFENHLKDMNNSTGKLVRGMRDLVNFPKTTKQVFEEIQKMIHDSSSRHAEEINKLNKVLLDSVRTHGANSNAIKQQTQGMIQSVNSLKQFKQSAKDFNSLIEQKEKIKARRDEIKAGTGTIPDDKEDVRLAEAAKHIDDSISELVKLIRPQLESADDGFKSMTDEMKGAYAQHSAKIKEVMESLSDDAKLIDNEQLQELSKIADLQKANLQANDAANKGIQSHLVDTQSRYKAMTLAIVGIAGAVGKGINASTLSRLGANLADNNYMTAGMLGMSPSELHSVAKTSMTELGLAGGTFNAGDALSDSGLMLSLQDTARQIGLIGPEGTKAALEAFNFQLRTGQYDPTASNADRIKSADSFLKAVKYGAAQIHAMPEEYLNEIKGMLDSGDFNPLIDQLDKSTLTGDAYINTLVDNITAIKGNIRNLGLNSNYLKMGIELQKKAAGTGFQAYIEGQIGTSMGISSIESFTGQKLNERDREMLYRFQDVKDITKVGDEDDQARILEILTAVGTKQRDILTRRGQGKATAGEMADMTFANTLIAMLPSDAINQSNVDMAYEGKFIREEVSEGKLPDGTTPLVNKTEEALKRIIAPLNAVEKGLLDFERAIQGVLRSPFFSAVAGPLAFAGNALLEGVATTGAIVAADRMGLLTSTTPDADGKAGKGKFKMSNMMKGKTGKALVAAGVLAALYGGYSYLSSDSGNGGSGGGPTIGPNGEISEASFNIQNATLNIGSTSGTGVAGADGKPNPEMLEKIVAYSTTAVVGGTVLSSIMSTLKNTPGMGAAAKGLAVGKNLIKGSLPVTAMMSLAEASWKSYNTSSSDYGEYLGISTGNVFGDLLARTIGLQHDLRAIAVRNISLGLIETKTVAESRAENPKATWGSDVKGTIDYYTNNDEPVDLYPWMPKYIKKSLEFADHSKPLEESKILKFIDKDKDAQISAIAEQEKKMAETQKTIDDERSKLDPTAIEFMDKISGFLETIAGFIPIWKTEETKKQLEARNDKQIAASFEQQVYDSIELAGSKIAKNIARANESPFK